MKFKNSYQHTQPLRVVLLNSLFSSNNSPRKSSSTLIWLQQKYRHLPLKIIRRLKLNYSKQQSLQSLSEDRSLSMKSKNKTQSTFQTKIGRSNPKFSFLFKAWHSIFKEKWKNGKEKTKSCVETRFGRKKPKRVTRNLNSGELKNSRNKSQRRRKR